MSWGQGAWGYAKRLGPVLSAVCAGLAAVLLVWSVGLALWSWLLASPSPALGAWERYHYSPWGSDSLGGQTPQMIAVTVCAISAVLLMCVLVAWRLRRTELAVWALPALVAVVALGLMYLRSRGLAEFVGWLQGYPHTAQMPAALAAWRLEALAVIALIVGCPAYVRLARRSWRRRAVAGTVLGLVLGISATTLALYAGDDRRFVDASVTTAPVPELAVPPALGTKHFTVQIAAVSEHHRRWFVQPVVGGFVTLGDGRITAFDGKGNERWHYRRYGPGESQVSSVQVFDDGRTVVAGLGSHPSVLIGFDAASGRQLWWSSDQALIGTYRAVSDRTVVVPRPYLLDYNVKAQTWTRFDTRTGRPMWTSPVPEPQCQYRFDAAGRSPQALLWCPDGGHDTVRFTSVNPDTGETAWETTFSPEPPFKGVSAALAGREGTVVWVYRGNEQSTSFYINAATKQAHQLASAVRPIVTVDDADDFLALVGNRLSLRGADGIEQCAFSDGPPLLHVDGKAIILKEQTVFGMSPGLQTYYPNTCAPLSSITLPSIPEALVAAPGVVLVVRTDATGTWIDGYA
ncbi:PQQ-binding-like beta-propeller repeat protein [Mycolicibacterium sp.]|uniref:outer membrane protein assembly factor BamB family protein n=1 Tax=Mycolicibacterium sp. TaxID=2320850 RepID=UPI0037CBC66A